MRHHGFLKLVCLCVHHSAAANVCDVSVPNRPSPNGRRSSDAIASADDLGGGTLSAWLKSKSDFRFAAFLKAKRFGKFLAVAAGLDYLLHAPRQFIEFRHLRSPA